MALRLEDAAGVLDIKQANGEVIPWRRTAWKGPLVVRVERQSDKTVKVSIGLQEGDSVRELKSASLKKGESVSIRPGVEVPEGFFGTNAKPVKFTISSQGGFRWSVAGGS
ncbi:hypothetical protein [Myxococcus guangdongensis]|uniref:hypothetical protein n=1 Tax=Myxococcus guangdongensis TaxID=2906760 RepID=UPI0020A73338|nr:hypothetical protein [Myxococcus guangdongensis]